MLSSTVMERRKEELYELQHYITKMHNEISMVLQNLQWDQKHLLQGYNMVVCSHNKNHRIPEHKVEEHEMGCLLKSQGYEMDDMLLPDAICHNAKTCVKFSKEHIKQIIETASLQDQLFRKGVRCDGPEALTQERLTSTYTTDERRALYDATVATAPTLTEDVDYTLPSSGGETRGNKEKTRLEVLAEQRDLKRRRAKYRVATKSKNYSQVLREVIGNQMEMYATIRADAAASTDAADVRHRDTNIIKKDNDPPRERSSVEFNKEAGSRRTHNDQEQYRNSRHRNSSEILKSKYKRQDSYKNKYEYKHKHRTKDEGIESDHERSRSDDRYKIRYDGSGRRYDSYSKYNSRDDRDRRQEQYDKRERDKQGHRRSKYERYYKDSARDSEDKRDKP